MEEIFINIDSKYRDQILYPNESKFRINLEKTYKNISSITISSLEINNSINYISTTKNNNFITIHLPNKLNDPDGISIVLYDGLLQLITTIQTIFNGIFNGIFNSNLQLQKLSYNNKPFAEKYFYIFYLNDPCTVSITFNYTTTKETSDVTQPFIIIKGWYSVYGIVMQIQNFIINITDNITKKNIFKSINYYQINNPIILNIFDRRFRAYTESGPGPYDCKRIDTIDFTSTSFTDLKIFLNTIKQTIYNFYIYDTTTFIPTDIPTGSNILYGILDKLHSNKFIIPQNNNYINANNFLNSNSLYYINNNNQAPGNDSIQLYNLSLNVDYTGLRVFFNNSFTDNTTSNTNLGKFFYYDNSTPDTQSWTFSNNSNKLTNLLDRDYLKTKLFITLEQYNDPLYIPSLYKDIPEFEIDFSTQQQLENPVTNGLVDIKKLEYPSVGYYMGYRPDLKIPTNRFLKSSTIDDTDRIIRADKIFDTSGDNYIFIKINNWGYIDFFGEPYMAKILLTSGLGNPKLDAFVNQGYRFRQPININKLDIELVDYLGNTLDLNGFDFSTSIQLKQFISSDQKDTAERQAIVFNY